MAKRRTFFPHAQGTKAILHSSATCARIARRATFGFGEWRPRVRRRTPVRGTRRMQYWHCAGRSSVEETAAGGLTGAVRIAAAGPRSGSLRRRARSRPAAVFLATRVAVRRRAVVAEGLRPREEGGRALAVSEGPPRERRGRRVEPGKPEGRLRRGRVPGRIGDVSLSLLCVMPRRRNRARRATRRRASSSRPICRRRRRRRRRPPRERRPPRRPRRPVRARTRSRAISRGGPRS